MNVHLDIPEAALKEAVRAAVRELLPTQPMPLPRVSYKLKEAAQVMGLSVGFLRAEIAKKRLSDVKLDRCLLITAAEMQRYLAGHQMTDDGGNTAANSEEL
jgi:hypothetical protein